jgi:hypothetical protein
MSIMPIEEIKKHFLIPIELNTKKHDIFNNLYEDLELLKTKEGGDGFFYQLYKPNSQAGKIMVEKLSKTYSSDMKFLKDSQKLYKQCGLLHKNPKLCEETWELWNKTKNDSNFHDKYQFINMDKVKWLNKSSVFLLILTFYSILSPLLNLIAPLIILLLPFIILKIMRIPVTAQSYTTKLLEQLDRHSFGQLFTRFWDVPISQRVYLLICFGMYVYNLYENIISCYQFYLNTHYINTYFHKMKNFLTHTRTELKKFIGLIKPLKTYDTYRNYLTKKFHDIDTLHKTLAQIPSANLNPMFLNSMGYILKQFYTINTSKEIEHLMNFSFAFNGYAENIHNLSATIQDKSVNKARIVNRKKLVVKFKDCYYPLIEGSVVKNNIDLSKNLVITGPNAAGKTTILKTVLLNILLTQQIGFGFYKKATIAPFDFIHCYLNIPDTSGRDSLFQAEARRCGNILELTKKHPNKKHFCIFDELYSGTNPYEAIASAYGYLKNLSKNSNIKFMLTTHFIKLCKLLDKNNNIQNCNMQTTIIKEDPIYSYKLENGISYIKGGICVLKDLGYPEDILSETKQIIKTL